MTEEEEAEQRRAAYAERSALVAADMKRHEEEMAALESEKED